jgi:hypothetical protein
MPSPSTAAGCFAHCRYMAKTSVWLRLRWTQNLASRQKTGPAHDSSLKMGAGLMATRFVRHAARSLPKNPFTWPRILEAEAARSSANFFTELALFRVFSVA